MRSVGLAAIAFGSLVALAACDDSQVAHRMSPGWERMQTQARAETYGESAFFPDHRAMRTPPPGTMPTNAVDDEERMPPTLDLNVQLIQRGRVSFDTICAACHGIQGDGESVVATKMQERRPPSLHEARIVQMSDVQLAQIVRQGYGFMPPFAAALDRDERWEIVAYVRALQATREPTRGGAP